MPIGFPDAETAGKELRLAGERNPGPWVAHSRNTGLAARYIARACPGLDEEKACVLGLLHDIGRGAGKGSGRHILEGYRFCAARGWDAAAKICMTHSFMIQNVEAKIGTFDVTPEEKDFIRRVIDAAAYDEYDRLLQLCDSLALAEGFCLLEKRFVDVTRRYGVSRYTVARWDAVFEIKAAFERRAGRSVYDLLPGVRETTFLETPHRRPDEPTPTR